MSNKAERKGRGKGGKFKKNKKATTLSTEDVDYLVARYISSKWLTIAPSPFSFL